MSPAILALIAQIIEMLVSAATAAPAVIAAGQTAIGLLHSNTDPTPEQEAAIRAALDSAHGELQG